MLGAVLDWGLSAQTREGAGPGRGAPHGLWMATRDCGFALRPRRSPGLSVKLTESFLRFMDQKHREVGQGSHAAKLLGAGREGQGAPGEWGWYHRQLSRADTDLRRPQIICRTFWWVDPTAHKSYSGISCIVIDGGKNSQNRSGEGENPFPPPAPSRGGGRQHTLFRKHFYDFPHGACGPSHGRCNSTSPFRVPQGPSGFRVESRTPAL